jgi:hypothetical protein
LDGHHGFLSFYLICSAKSGIHDLAPVGTILIEVPGVETIVES